MSDTAEGEGWWQASNGKWYGPETHPERRAAEAQAREEQSLRDVLQHADDGISAGKSLSTMAGFILFLSLVGAVVLVGTGAAASGAGDDGTALLILGGVSVVNGFFLYAVLNGLAALVTVKSAEVKHRLGFGPQSN